MNLSNLHSLKGLAIAGCLVLGGLSMQAVTFVEGGLIYKSSSSNVTIQPIGTALTTDQEAPTAYSGDIVVPATVTYDGKTYTVTGCAASTFEGQDVTSFKIEGEKFTRLYAKMFKDCTKLTKVELPATVSRMDANVFEGCTSLTKFEVPVAVTSLGGSTFAGCTALESFIVPESDKVIQITASVFDNATRAAMRTLVIGREITGATTRALAPFRNSAITSLTINGTAKSISTYAFEGCAELTEVKIDAKIEEMGEGAFYECAKLASIALPETLTAIPGRAFAFCGGLKSVEMPAVESIGESAFFQTAFPTIQLPATIKSVGSNAFYSCSASKGYSLNLPSGLKTIGEGAFHTVYSVAEVTIPASVETIGATAFNLIATTKINVDAANKTFAVDQNALVEPAAKRVLGYASGNVGSAFAGDYETIDPSAFVGADLVMISLPNAKSWGNYALFLTKIQNTLELKGVLGSSLLYASHIGEVCIDSPDVPDNFLTSATAGNVKFHCEPTTIGQEAFSELSGLNALDLGSRVVYVGKDAFKGSKLNVAVASAKLPTVNGTVGGEQVSLSVPAALADAYRQSEAWDVAEVNADAALAAGDASQLPAGLYYGNADGSIGVAYADGQSETFNLNLPHAINIVATEGALYVASAGSKMGYSATADGDGDGQLVKLTRVGNELAKVSIIDNTGKGQNALSALINGKINNSNKDPHHLTLFEDNLYVLDRNVAIHKLSLDDVNVSLNLHPSWVENGWLGYYGAGWAFGCIKCGLHIEKDANGNNEYWLGMKYNANGIYRFNDEHIGTAAEKGELPSHNVLLKGMTPAISSFYVDRPNNHLYAFIESATGLKHGLYRFDLDKCLTSTSASAADYGCVLVDGSPNAIELNSPETINVCQLSADGEYLYWAYRTPSQAELDSDKNASRWNEPYDASNPLHKDGIKRIKLGQAQPSVEMVLPGVRAYGVAAVSYLGSVKPASTENIIADKADARPIAVVGNAVVASCNTEVSVYDIAGNLVAARSLRSGEALRLASKGAYIAVAQGVAVKFIVK